MTLENVTLNDAEPILSTKFWALLCQSARQPIVPAYLLLHSPILI